ncbi:MAG: gliding motility-associated C-terminal domain-containing protein [Flavobacteriales bacterium]|nr:gliding motility-associated C-terminal domain-containing protein [Flavobacteriales bacterium]
MNSDSLYQPIKALKFNALQFLGAIGAILGAFFPIAEAIAQCPSTINTFPYQEGFETNPAWTSGGTASDWAWGTPSHPSINTAAEGTKGWFVGSLSGTYYEFGQQSWLESPCFDFTALQYPYISFKLYWECERQYDGLGFQYSLDQGTTWSNVGSFNGPNDCLNTNWFNTQSITTLYQANPKMGWSGRAGPTVGSCAGGQGSEAWVTSSQCLNDLQGEPSVKFRFIFGAGTQCNDFDGIGVDLVQIGEAPPNQAAFAFQCTGNTIDFQDNSTPCPSARTWDFGDPASGADNTSTSNTPQHVFSAAGTYQVTLTVSGPCNAPSTITQSVTITGVTVQTTDAGCTQDQGTASALVDPGVGLVSYAWSPGGQTTQTITGLAPGDVTVSVTGNSICAAQATGNIAMGSAGPTVTETHTNITCAAADDGTATLTVTGGAMPFAYVWSPNIGATGSVTGLAPDTYTCVVTDASGCEGTVDVIITEPLPLTITPQADVTICSGDATDLTATADGGIPGYVFTWSPEGPSVSPAANTVYSVTATDANGCSSASADVLVTVGASVDAAFTISDTLGCAPFCVTFTDQSATPGTRTWNFSDGSDPVEGNEVEHCFNEAGSYDATLTITTADGCEGTITLVDAVDVLPVPVAVFVSSPGVTTIDQPTFQFIDQSTDATIWNWSFGDPDDSLSTDRSPTFAYNEVGCYTVELEVANDLGCTSRTSAEVCVEDEFLLFAPNAFTPNNDQINDGFEVITSVADPGFFQLQLFDRWGQVIFTATQKDQEWTGEGAPIGIYAWQLKIQDTHGGLQERQGHVTLVR